MYVPKIKRDENGARFVQRSKQKRKQHIVLERQHQRSGIGTLKYHLVVKNVSGKMNNRSY